MTTVVTFPRPKDPADQAWYTINFGAPLSSVGAAGVTCTVSTNAAVPSGASQWTTAGDALAGTPLTAAQAQLTADRQGVTFLLAGGAPGLSYAVRADAVDSTGDELFRSAVLTVTGQ